MRISTTDIWEPEPPLALPEPHWWRRQRLIASTFDHVSTQKMEPNAIFRLKRTRLERGTPEWGREFPDDPVREKRRTPTQAQIERYARDWNVLINSLDFESGDWYERGSDAEGGWHRIGFFRVYELLDELDFAPSRHEEIIQNFYRRDGKKVTWKRGREPKLKPMERTRAEQQAERNIRLRAELDSQGELGLSNE